MRREARRVARLKACRRDKALTDGDTCPICGSTDLTPSWEGVVAIVDPVRSSLAKRLGITRSGLYALRVLE